MNLYNKPKVGKLVNVEWSSVGSISAPGEKEVIRTVTYEKNPPVIFSPKSSVKRLDVRVTSNKSQDEELLRELLQKVRSN